MYTRLITRVLGLLVVRRRAVLDAFERYLNFYTHRCSRSGLLFNRAIPVNPRLHLCLPRSGLRKTFQMSSGLRDRDLATPYSRPNQPGYPLRSARITSLYAQVELAVRTGYKVTMKKGMVPLIVLVMATISRWTACGEELGPLSGLDTVRKFSTYAFCYGTLPWAPPAQSFRV